MNLHFTPPVRGKSLIQGGVEDFVCLLGDAFAFVLWQGSGAAELNPAWLGSVCLAGSALPGTTAGRGDKVLTPCWWDGLH